MKEKEEEKKRKEKENELKKNNPYKHIKSRVNIYHKKDSSFDQQNNEKPTKPFEIKKFSAIMKNNDKANDEKNNTMFNIYNENKKMKLNSFGDNYSCNDKNSLNEKKKKKNKNGITALKEIENLVISLILSSVFFLVIFAPP